MRNTILNDIFCLEKFLFLVPYNLEIFDPFLQEFLESQGRTWYFTSFKSFLLLASKISNLLFFILHLIINQFNLLVKLHLVWVALTLFFCNERWTFCFKSYLYTIMLWALIIVELVNPRVLILFFPFRRNVHLFSFFKRFSLFAFLIKGLFIIVLFISGVVFPLFMFIMFFLSNVVCYIFNFSIMCFLVASSTTSVTSTSSRMFLWGLNFFCGCSYSWLSFLLVDLSWLLVCHIK